MYCLKPSLWLSVTAQGLTTKTIWKRYRQPPLCGGNRSCRLRADRGIGWFLLARYGKKTVSLKQAVNAEKPHMPGIETVANALLQIVTIGIGSPLGKEGAPRMVGALVANRVGNWFRARP